MEYIYAAMLLHATGKPVNEEGVKKVLTAAGAKADDSRVKALIAALENVNIEEAMKSAAVAPVASAAPAAQEAKKEGKKEEKKEEKPTEEEAAAGLSALFG